MDNIKRSITVPSDHDDNHETGTILPSYLIQHTRLGFDSDDVAALINSIDASQGPASQFPSSLPHLPAEILLHILDYVPVEYVLDWRRVCRGFRDAIDGRVMFDYLNRTELIGYIGPRKDLLRRLTVEDYESIHLLRMCFRDMSTFPEENVTDGPKGPKWSGICATFDNRDGWSERYERGVRWDTELGTGIEDLMDPNDVTAHSGALNWCVKLDSAVLDVEPYWKRYLQVDIPSATVVFPWRDLLFSFLKTETAIRKMIEEKRHCTFTFNLQDDCLRAIRRQRLRSALDHQIKEDRQVAWAMGLLPPLFGKPRYDTAYAPWDSLEHAENDALRMLTVLRREASMSTQELAHLKQLASDRTTMAQELKSINTEFVNWKKNLYGRATQRMQGFHIDMDLDVGLSIAANPLFWDEKTTMAVEQEVRKWRTQRKTTEQVMALLRASNDALEVPEDAFDDLGSQLEESEQA